MTRPLRILLVEDEAMIAMCLQMQLENAGYEICQTVATGQEAIAAARRESPDILLMDIRLAGELDGIEAASRIKDFCPAPVIFITGYSDPGLRERALQLEPLGFFIKPLKIEELQTTINSHFQP